MTGPQPRILSRRSDALANQSRVLEAARLVFAEQGLSAEIKDVADRAGVGVATIYRGFGSKEGLVRATLEQADDAIDEVVALAERASEAGSGLRVLIAGLIDYAESYGWLIQASIAGAEIGRSQSSLDRRAERRERMVSLIRREIEQGDIPPDLPEDVVKLVLDGVVVMLTIRKMRQEPYPSPPQIVDGLIRMLTERLG